MTKKESFKEEFFKADGEKKVDRIILFIHMPDDSEEVIVNSKPFEKVKYIDGAYTEELVHKNNEQIYISDYIFAHDEDAMDFGEALYILKEGGIVTRKGWNGKGMFLYYVPEGNYLPCTDAARWAFKGEAVPYGAYIAMKTAQGNVVPWLASQTDLLAEDWVDMTPIMAEERG